MKQVFHTPVLLSLTLAVLFALLGSVLLPNPIGAQQTEKTYHLGSDSQQQTGTPKGTVTEHQWLESKIYPKTDSFLKHSLHKQTRSLSEFIKA